jgi:hypothetical protein
VIGCWEVESRIIVTRIDTGNYNRAVVQLETGIIAVGPKTSHRGKQYLV